MIVIRGIRRWICAGPRPPFHNFDQQPPQPKPKHPQPDKTFKQQFKLNLKQSFQLTRLYRKFRKAGRKCGFPLRRIVLVISLIFIFLLGIPGKSIALQQPLKLSFMSIVDELLFAAFKDNPTETKVQKYLSRMFNGAIILFDSDIFDIGFINSTLLKIIDISLHYPVNHLIYGDIFCFLSVLLSRIGERKPDLLLDKQFQQLMFEIVDKYSKFGQAHKNQKLDDQFMVKQAKFIVNVLQYVLIYSQQTDKVGNMLRELAERNVILGNQIIENQGMLREMIRHLSQGNYKILDVLLEVSKTPIGCNKLHNLNIIGNLKTRLSKPQTKSKIQLIGNCLRQ